MRCVREAGPGGENLSKGTISGKVLPDPAGKQLGSVIYASGFVPSEASRWFFISPYQSSVGHPGGHKLLGRWPVYCVWARQFSK